MCRFGEQLKQELGQMLTDTNVSSVEEAMRLVEQRAATDEAFAARLSQAASELSKVGVIQTVGQSGDETGMYARSEEHTSELQSLMRISYAVFCLKKKKIQKYR